MQHSAALPVPTVIGLAELVRSALDAGADRIDVSIHRGRLLLKYDGALSPAPVLPRQETVASSSRKLACSSARELWHLLATSMLAHPGASVTVEGVRLALRLHDATSQKLALPGIVSPGRKTVPACLEIVEWQRLAGRRLYFCDAEGRPLAGTAPGVRAPGVSFSAYLRCAYFSELATAHRLEIGNYDEPTARLVKSAKNALRLYFRSRRAERGQEPDPGPGPAHHGTASEWSSA